jgi:DNA topoisomerase-1
MLKQLVHNGILVPDVPLPSDMEITVRGERIALSAKQIEMVMAWARKQGTPYVEDSVFVRNFMRDLSKELSIKPRLQVDEVDFGPAIRIVQNERAAKEQLTKEERKALAAERKAVREELGQQYGQATVDGEQVDIANYIAEPSGIFMGRGRHPMRGKWKEGPKQSDITLNLSPDAANPPGDWAEIVWQPESLWVARWRDKLSGKLKYVWLSDAAPVKQEREAAKFDQAVELDRNLDQVREYIENDLTDQDPKRRMVATACYLIDTLCLRVGDEKDADEADTIGATTLRPEHVTLHDDGTAEFRFLGKDSVLWHKRIPLPPTVLQNLEELIQNAQPPDADDNNQSHPTRSKPQIFPRIGSSDVNTYLSEILPSLTAKVFRTHHATEAVRRSLEESNVTASDPEHRKWGAVALANLEAAILCNHYKKGPANWSERRERAKERLEKYKERDQKYRLQVREAREALAEVRREAREKRREAKTKTVKQRQKVKERYEKRIARAEKKLAAVQDRWDRARLAKGKAETKDLVTVKKRSWNLNTSLKSYIDPRVLYRWGQKVEYDVLETYYPKALRSKFAWVRAPAPAALVPAQALTGTDPEVQTAAEQANNE